MTTPAAPNLLYYGDNLDVLRLHVRDQPAHGSHGPRPGSRR